MTSLQGLGNYGLQRFGINPRGAMDRTAVRLINLLLGNPECVDTVEMHFPAPEIRFEERCLFALGGADLSAELDGRPIENWCVREALPSSKLRFRKHLTGSRCYLAVSGGLRMTVPEGNFETVRLKKGTHLARAGVTESGLRVGGRLSRELLPGYTRYPEIRVIPSAEFSNLTAQGHEAIEGSDFEISRSSDRMGFRLIGPDLTLSRQVDLVSASVNFGTVQLLPDGQLIVLMADHQTTGGYPRLANVISVDLPLLAQLGGGDKFRLKLVSVAEAEELCREFEDGLNWLKTGIRFGRYW